jgi:threonine dehydratase
MVAIALEDLRAAAATIESQAVRTPVVQVPALDDRVGAAVHLKVEAAQRAGSFKFRGAFNRLSQIPDAERSRGVVAVSSGNHGAAVACAGALLDIPVTVFIPHDAPQAKRALMERFGAEIVTFDRAIPDREVPARERVAETGATFVHPFEDRAVMTGQGTAALELFDDVGPLDHLVVPMSGGGLMAGCASAAHWRSPRATVVGVEPEAADDTRRSFEAGRPVKIDQPATIADGLAVTSPGVNTFAINRRLVDRVVTVSETEIISAMKLLFDEADLVVEPSGAVGVAALLSRTSTLDELPGASEAGATVGVILSGGNIDRTSHRDLIGSIA